MSGRGGGALCASTPRERLFPSRVLLHDDDARRPTTTTRDLSSSRRRVVVAGAACKRRDKPEIYRDTSPKLSAFLATTFRHVRCELFVETDFRFLTSVSNAKRTVHTKPEICSRRARRPTGDRISRDRKCNLPPRMRRLSDVTRLFPLPTSTNDRRPGSCEVVLTSIHAAVRLVV